MNHRRVRVEPNSALKKLLYSKKLIAKPNISDVRPSITSVVKQSTNANLDKTVEIAVATNNLSNKELAATIAQLRKYHRFDTVDKVVRQAKSSGLVLDKSVVAATMACANETKQWHEALRHYSEFIGGGGHTNGHLLNTALQSLKQGRRYRKVDTVFREMCASKLVDSYATHTMLNIARNKKDWAGGINIYNLALESGCTPNAIVSLEYMRTLRVVGHYNHAFAAHASQKELKRLCKKDPSGVKVGHYNAAISIALSRKGKGHANWAKALRLVDVMQKDDCRERGYVPCVPNNSTYSVFFEDGVILPSAVALHMVKQVQLAGLKMNAMMYKKLFVSLFNDGHYDVVKRFAERTIEMSSEEDIGNPNVSLRELYMGILDALTLCTEPRETASLLALFSDQLEGVVGEATAGLGLIGQAHERWIVEGRVAVIDENILLSGNCDSLPDRFDSIFIPFSVARAIVVKASREPKNVFFWRRAMDSLLRLSTGGGEGAAAALQVLPLVHQLDAHRALISRASAAQRLALPEEEEVEALTEETPSIAEDSGEIPMIRGEGDAPLAVVAPRKNAASPQAPTKKTSDVLRWTNATTTTATALMLRRLNPDADILVLSNSSKTRTVAEEAGLAAVKLHAGELKRVAPTGLQVKRAARRNNALPPVFEAQASEALAPEAHNTADSFFGDNESVELEDIFSGGTAHVKSTPPKADHGSVFDFISPA